MRDHYVTRSPGLMRSQTRHQHTHNYKGCSVRREGCDSGRFSFLVFLHSRTKHRKLVLEEIIPVNEEVCVRLSSQSMPHLSACVQPRTVLAQLSSLAGDRHPLGRRRLMCMNFPLQICLLHCSLSQSRCRYQPNQLNAQVPD